MRIWHKSLVRHLPAKQLVSQWRECCAIARNIAVNGTPNHLLVNRVLEYPPSHLFSYGVFVVDEMTSRGYHVSEKSLADFIRHCGTTDVVAFDDLFAKWHDTEYFNICWWNLREKYDCGGLTDEEWTEVCA